MEYISSVLYQTFGVPNKSKLELIIPISEGSRENIINNKLYYNYTISFPIYPKLI